MKSTNFIKFILIGYIFAQVIEFQFNVLVTGNIGNWIFTLLAYPIILAVAYLSIKIFDKFKNKVASEFIYFLFWSCFGLFIMEWLVIGNSPWGNPDANQIGMFSFWAALFFMPKIFINSNIKVSKLKKHIFYYFLFYSIITTVVGLLLPPAFRLFFLVWFEIIGYSIMMFFYWSYFKNIKNS